MQNLDILRVNTELHESVRRLVDRLGPVRIEATSRWQHIVNQFDVRSAAESAAATEPTTVVVGSPADLVKHARRATGDFGFVVVDAQIAASPVARVRPGVHTWRDDVTLDLWHMGWSPLNIDRILVPAGHVVLEFVIGDVCPVPEVQVSDV